MYKGIRVLSLVPVRGGSKSIPRKNAQLLGGKPLMVWPIETSLATSEIDRTIISSDDSELRNIGRSHGAETYHRPISLAEDSALVVDVIRDFWATVKKEGESAEILVLLEATSPFRTPKLVSRCIERLVDEDLDSIATFHEAAVSPERTWKFENGSPVPFIDGATPWRPRQEIESAYQLDGRVYVLFPDRLPDDSPGLLFGKSGGELVHDDILLDIDTPIDLEIANAIIRFRR